MVFSQYFCVPVPIIVPPVFRIYSPVIHGTNNGQISDLPQRGSVTPPQYDKEMHISS
jgi:hypothetical protein